MHRPVRSGCRPARSRRHVLPGSCLRVRYVTRRWGVGAPEPPIWRVSHLMSVELVAAYPGVLTGQSPVLPIPAGLGGWGPGQAVDLMQVAAGHAERGVLAWLLVFPAASLAGHDA